VCPKKPCFYDLISTTKRGHGESGVQGEKSAQISLRKNSLKIFNHLNAQWTPPYQPLAADTFFIFLILTQKNHFFK
jgi:hypothetical protein